MVKGLDRKIGQQNRKILMLLDIAPSHPKLQLQNLPANTTSQTQPMDMGIIQTTKLKFKKKQVRYNEYFYDEKRKIQV